MFKRKNIKRSRKKIKAYFLFVFLIFAVVFAYSGVIFLRKPVFISPLGYTSSRDVSLETVLNEANIPFTSIANAPDGSYIVALEKGGSVNFSPKENLKKQITSLQLLLKQLTIEGKSFKSIDFRFEKPVVAYD